MSGIIGTTLNQGFEWEGVEYLPKNWRRLPTSRLNVIADQLSPLIAHEEVQYVVDEIYLEFCLRDEEASERQGWEFS